MEVKFTRNHFETPKNIIWDDVIQQISSECLNGTHKLVVDPSVDSPTIVLHDNYLLGTINDAFNEVQLETQIKIVHLYISFAKNASTFGRHRDDENVLIVQSIGNVSYRFDNQTIYNLSPGDSLLIPMGVYHEPIVHGSRVTLSFSWQ